MCKLQMTITQTLLGGSEHGFKVRPEFCPQPHHSGLSLDVPFLERPSPYPKEVPGVVTSHCALLITFLGLLTIYNDFICVHVQRLFPW